MGPGEVVSGDRVAVGPLGVLAEVEDPGFALVDHLPGLGDAGLGLVVVTRVVGDEAFRSEVMTLFSGSPETMWGSRSAGSEPLA